MALEPLQPSRPPKRNANAWMLTFTDLVSLMLTFFVLLFSMSNVKIDEWENVIDSLSQTLNPEREEITSVSTATHNIETAFRKRAINLDYLTSVLKETIEGDALLGATQFMLLEDRLVMALPGDLLFQPGQAVMTERAEEALFQLGGILRNIGNQIGVNGHSDPSPVTGGVFASNWELSMARAGAVANALTQAGYEDPIVSFGYSNSRYAQLPDLPEDRRLAIGRRVDLVIFPTAGGL